MLYKQGLEIGQWFAAILQYQMIATGSLAGLRTHLAVPVTAITVSYLKGWCCTLKLWLGSVLKVIDVLRDNLPVDNQVPLLVHHVRNHKHLQRHASIGLLSCIAEKNDHAWFVCSNLVASIA